MPNLFNKPFLRNHSPTPSSNGGPIESFYNSPLLLQIKGHTSSTINGYTNYIRIYAYHIRFNNNLSRNPSGDDFVCQPSIDEVTIILDQPYACCVTLADDVKKGTFFENGIDILETSNINGETQKIVQHLINGQVINVEQDYGSKNDRIVITISPSAIISIMNIYQEGESSGGVSAFVNMNTRESSKSFI